MNADLAASYEALRNIYTNHAYSNLAAGEAIGHHPGCSGSFVRSAVKETLRQTFLLDHYVAALSKNGLRGMKSRTLVLLRLGLRLLELETGIPDAVIVHEIVELARKKAQGSHGFVNAVLRSYLRERGSLRVPEGMSAEALSVRYSVHTALVRMILSQYGETDGIRLMEALNAPCEVGLRVNLLRGTREDVLRELSEAGVSAHLSGECETGLVLESGNVIGQDGFRNGRYSVQGIASQMAVEALSPEPGSRVLDLCAAPGGKTAAIAERMEDRGSITACDLHEHRADLIRKNAERLGLTSIHAECRDAAVPVPGWENRYDLVVADVPCSGLGTIPAKPEIKLWADPSGYAELYGIQRKILENAFRYVRPGGKLLYATCTFNREENEGITEPFLLDHAEAEAVEKEMVLPYNRTGLYYTIIRKH